MKNLIILLCIFVSFPCFAGDEEETLAVLQANFDAANREDVDDLLATCSKDMPDRKKFREECVKAWKEKDIHYSLVDFKFLGSDGNFAVADVVQKTHTSDRKSASEEERFFRNGTALLPDADVSQYRVAFKKDFGRWKCYLTISEPVPAK